jgi:hypothetical protein
MKCPNFFRTAEMVSKKGKKFTRRYREWEKTDANEPCGGKIIVEVSAEEVPDWGGTYPSLEVRYKCSKCKEDIFDQKLPRDEDGISDIITQYVEKL